MIDQFLKRWLDAGPLVQRYRSVRVYPASHRGMAIHVRDGAHHYTHTISIQTMNCGNVRLGDLIREAIYKMIFKLRKQGNDDDD